MPLNLNPGTGSPYVKFNAKEGRFFYRPEGSKADVEVPSPRFAFDFATIRTGWFLFSQTGPPKRVMDRSLTEMASAPDDESKRGFVLWLFGADNIPNIGALGLREFASTAGSTIIPIMDMYNDWEQEMDCHNLAGVYQFTGTERITSKNGVNHQPIFHFEKWVPRTDIQAFMDLPSAESLGDPRPAPPSVPDAAETYVEDDSDIPF